MISKKILANSIRILSMDIVQNANSGHPGSPMGMADIAEVLWRDFMVHNPKNPNWINRDRFVLSNGHASALLYSILHMTGYNISISDLKNFRKINSNTPGHPEYSHTEGVEVTTGPLGQGLANAVGLSISEKILSSRFNKENLKLIDHYIYVFVGDGCLMEGISHECCSLAGKLKLGKLIVIYDKNNISIDGNTEDWFIDDTEKRFISYNWHVIKDINAYDDKEIKDSISIARNILDKPSLLIFNTVIAFGSPNKSGDYKTHGNPLGEDEVMQTRENLNWKYDPFIIPECIYKLWNAVDLGEIREKKWNKTMLQYKLKFPKLFNEFNRIINKILPENWDLNIKKIIEDISNNKLDISTRKASQNFIEKINNFIPELIGGSSDLTSSVLTNSSKSIPINKYSYGNYINYGVREFGMTAIGNGISLYKGLIPYSGTFLVFMDYAKNAIRMASLMNIQHILIYTHDSIGIGEDGPTHQPVEQLTDLRIIPNLNTWRPCDELETYISWKSAIERLNGPTALVLSRQELKYNIRSNLDILSIEKGGYIFKDCIKQAQLIIISTGSEIGLSIDLYNELTDMGFSIRVVSIPCTNIFDLQNIDYRNYILPKHIKKIAIEAGSTNFWYKYVGSEGMVIGIDSFGVSGNIRDIYEYFGFTKEKLLLKILNFINNN